MCGYSLNKQPKKQLRLAGMLLPLILLCLLAPLYAAPLNPSSYKTETMSIAGKPFKLKIAVTTQARKQGLMYIKKLRQDEGMLFIFPDNELQTFWMAHTFINLDLIFLDETGTIVALHTMKAEPPRKTDETESDYKARLRIYSSLKPVRFAIELTEGRIQALGLKTGETIIKDTERFTRYLAQYALSFEEGGKEKTFFINQ